MNKNAKYLGKYCVNFHFLAVKYFLISPCPSLSSQDEEKETGKAKVCTGHLEIQYKYLSCLPPFAIEGVGMRGFYI
jgi:hypothetical protein